MVNSFKFNRKKNRAKNGFTIIETLVAITILMIAVAGPLVVASRGLTTALYAKDQMTATFLAQESMEMIKNVRDNNDGFQTPDWLDVFGQNCIDTDKRCDLSPTDYQIKTGCDESGCQLYENGAGYSANGSSRATIFKRYFYIELLNAPDPAHARAVVVVNWNEGKVPYSLELKSELVNTVR